MDPIFLLLFTYVVPLYSNDLASLFCALLSSARNFFNAGGKDLFFFFGLEELELFLHELHVFFDFLHEAHFDVGGILLVFE